MSTIKPWYKQPWPWVLIILPLCAVVASVTTLIIAINNKPDMVVDDYYKKGKAINVDLTRLDNAYRLALKFELSVEQQQIKLTQTFGERQLAALRLNFIHRTQKVKDFSLLLSANANGEYLYTLEQPLTDKWTIQLESFDAKWRIQTVEKFPKNSITLLDAINNR